SGCATSPTEALFEPLASEVTITIAHTNDMHARGLETKTEIGYSRIAGYVAAQKAKGGNVLLLDAGDTLHGLPWANLERGASVMLLMNAALYDAMTTGNHDYNYGADRLVELAGAARFPLVAANVYKGGSRLFKPYVIKDVAGVRVAIFGLATPETLYKADPAGLVGVRFKDPIAEAQRLVNGELKGKYDVLICLSHVGLDASSDPTSERIAEALPQIDVLIDGHSHTSLAGAIKENQTATLIASAGANGTELGVVTLVVGTNRKVARKTAISLNLRDNASELVSDPEVKSLADGIAKSQEPMLAEIVAQSAIELEGKREIVRTSETNLGRLIANGMLVATGADIALMNGGGIRDSIPAGPIAKRQVYTVLPFGNYIMTTQVMGSELKAILENGVGKLPAADGRYPHLAGWSFSLDPSRPAGERVLDIQVKGRAVDPDKTYTLATLNFLMAGGDEYTMLAGKTCKEFPSDADIFIAHVKRLGTVSKDNITFAK
ncbi:MAG: bifunctional UDP-sugar hydrolase/5'-nucleotidase, partial [Spirochaetaceae bacterium]|nr:bifunctional UDP-sugar hydrolase/5'-nucleotidase [Spirochaetaceae bacterium]